MRKLTLIPTDATAHPVYLTAAAINSLIQTLPSSTAYCIGIVLIVMMTGWLMQHKGNGQHRNRHFQDAEGDEGGFHVGVMVMGFRRLLSPRFSTPRQFTNL